MILECDVLVVGAGPAGAVSALYCSKHGLNVILIEKNSKIGALNTKIDSSPDFKLTQIINELKLKTENLVYKSKWYAPSGRSFTLHSKIGEYYFKRGLDPDSFECSTVEKAVKYGCKLLLDTTIKEINKNGDRFIEVIVSQETNKIVIKPKIIIAADGGNSFFHKYIGQINKEKILGCGVTGKNFTQPDASEIYFDAQLSPGGYFYILTCSNGISSAAIGLDPNKIRVPIEEYFSRYLSKNPTIATKIISPDITFAGHGYLFRLNQHVYGNLILVGDAAGLIDSLLGYGMMPAIVSAYYAGKYCVEATNKGDYSILEGYELEIKKRFNKRFDYFYRKAFDSLNNQDIDLIIKMVNELEGRTNIDTFLHKLNVRNLWHAFVVFYRNLPRSALLLGKIIYHTIIY